MLDYTEKYYSKQPINSAGSEIKESIYSKLLKLCVFQVPQYFNSQVLIINEFLKSNEDKKYVRLSNKISLTSALECLTDNNSLDELHAYHLSLSEKPYVTAITVIRFFGRRYRRFRIRYNFDEFFNKYQEFGVYNLLFSEHFHNQLFGNLKKEKKITSLSCFNFNLTDCVLTSETLLRMWWDCIGIIMDVEYHQTLKRTMQYKNEEAESLLRNEWVLYKCVIIQCMLDVIILAQTEIKIESQVHMITSILCK